MSKNTFKHESFETVYRELLLPVTKFVFKKMGSRPDVAEEVISETFAAAWKGYNTFQHKSSYFTWLCRISLNKMADYYHDQVHENSRIIVPLIEAITATDNKNLSPEEAIALKELKKSVNDCLDSLPEEKRKLLKFRYWEDMSYNEIAKILGTTERSVEGKIYRAKEAFVTTWNERNSSNAGL